MSNNTVHPVVIKCPECKTIQGAIVENSMPFATFIHICEKCDYVIMESEWEEVKPIKTV